MASAQRVSDFMKTMIIRDSVTRWIFFEGLYILISTFYVCADGLPGLSKAFHYPIQLLTFYLFPWNYLLILKTLIETLALHRIPFSVIGQSSLVPTSHWLQGKCARINWTGYRWLPVWFCRITGSFLSRRILKGPKHEIFGFGFFT
jgi:hypothetical protein